MMKLAGQHPPPSFSHTKDRAAWCWDHKEQRWKSVSLQRPLPTRRNIVPAVSGEMGSCITELGKEGGFGAER